MLPAGGRQRPRGVPVDRRTVLAGALGAVLATAGCTPPGLPPVQTPTSPAPSPTTAVPNRSVVVGFDVPATGFNPHAIADFSPVTMAVAALVLPSVTWIDTDGNWHLDADVVESAAVSARRPYTVTYTLGRAASWSDGTPITGEDLNYLREQAATAPGVVDPAGYRLMSQIRSRQGGKVVDVEFISPFPAWHTLFRHLLPAHILKDAPGGWAEGLSAGIPVSGNRFKMASVDTVTGEITLQRNDKYWGQQRGPTTVVLRTGATSDLLAALGRGDVQAAELRPAPADAHAVAELPADRTALVPLAAVTQLVFNTVAGPASDAHIRAAVDAALDPAALRAALRRRDSGQPDAQSGSGSQPSGGPASPDAGPPTELPVTSPVRLAATEVLDAAKAPPVPAGPGPDPQRAAHELAAAGYRMSGLYVTRDGAPLVLRVGFPVPDRSLAAAAREIQRQLGAVGIEVDLVAHAAHRLLPGLAAGTCDSAVVTVPRGADAASALASQFGCAPTGPGPAGERPANPSGFCSPALQRELSDAIAGTATLDAARTLLATDRPALAIAQPLVLFVAPVAVDRLLGNGGKAGPSWVFGSPLAEVGDWPVR